MWKICLILLLSILIGYNLYDDFDPNILKNKNVVVTGASTGIGEQVAYHYARMGARVLVTSRTESKLKQVVENCYKIGSSDGLFVYHMADMSDMNSTKDLIKAAESKLGGIDILVLNHILVADMGGSIETEEYLTLLHDTFQVNFFSYAHLVSHALPVLQRSHGNVVVMSSVAGKIPQPFLGPYGSSKFALNGFFSSLRQEFELREIDVSITLCIIGLVDTENAVRNLNNFGAERILSLTPPIAADYVADKIIRAAARKQSVVYVPYFSLRLFDLINHICPAIGELVTKFLYGVRS